jgi:hypothetical protein
MLYWSPFVFGVAYSYPSILQNAGICAVARPHLNLTAALKIRIIAVADLQYAYCSYSALFAYSRGRDCSLACGAPIT